MRMLRISSGLNEQNLHNQKFKNMYVYIYEEYVVRPNVNFFNF